MPAKVELYQEVYQQIEAISRPVGLRRTSVARLALLVSGLIAAKSGVLRQVAAALDDLDLTGASGPESIERRLRRTLSDERLTAESCYLPVVRQVIDWAALRRTGRWLVLIVDESGEDERVHLFRVSCAYAGGSQALAWAIWPQNRRLAPTGSRSTGCWRRWRPWCRRRSRCWSSPTGPTTTRRSSTA